MPQNVVALVPWQVIALCFNRGALTTSTTFSQFMIFMIGPIVPKSQAQRAQHQHTAQPTTHPDTPLGSVKTQAPNITAHPGTESSNGILPSCESHLGRNVLKRQRTSSYGDLCSKDCFTGMNLKSCTTTRDQTHHKAPNFLSFGRALSAKMSSGELTGDSASPIWQSAHAWPATANMPESALSNAGSAQASRGEFMRVRRRHATRGTSAPERNSDRFSSAIHQAAKSPHFPTQRHQHLNPEDMNENKRMQRGKRSLGHVSFLCRSDFFALCSASPASWLLRSTVRLLSFAALWKLVGTFSIIAALLCIPSMPAVLQHVMAVYAMYWGLSWCMDACSGCCKAWLNLDTAPYFEEPFSATSLSDFWGRRWNITQVGWVVCSACQLQRQLPTCWLGSCQHLAAS